MVLIALLAVAAIAAAVGFALSRSVSAPGAVEPPAIVWAVGDGADDSARSKALGARIASVSSDRFLYLGDVYETGTYTEFRRNTPRPTDDSSADRADPGNHEWPNRRAGYNRYWKEVRGGRTMAPYYSFSVGGWQFLSVNSELPHRSGSAQLAWLKGRLGGGNCRIAFWPARAVAPELRTATRPTWTPCGRRCGAAPRSCSAATTTARSDGRRLE